MGADVTIYCLQNVTDYHQFERLSHDLMSLEGYSSIEPLGGFRDKGRDAIHISKSGQTTVFAYSVREDWRAKLAEDASKIKRHGHTCDQLVFITTSDFTAGERDEASSFVNNEFGWRLDLFGIERLRVLLDVTHPQVKGLHPQIFPPALLALQPQSSTSKDHVFIISAPEDRVLAYDGWETPIPLCIDIQHGDAQIERVAQDIFGLTKLNYNACRLEDAKPVTVGCSDAAGEILVSNPKVSHRKSNFKFYI